MLFRAASLQLYFTVYVLLGATEVNWANNSIVEPGKSNLLDQQKRNTLAATGVYACNFGCLKKHVVRAEKQSRNIQFVQVRLQTLMTVYYKGRQAFDYSFFFFCECVKANAIIKLSLHFPKINVGNIYLPGNIMLLEKHIPLVRPSARHVSAATISECLLGSVFWVSS